MNAGTNAPTRSLERLGFVALVALLMAPVLAQGLWRPLVHFLGPSGEAGRVTIAALSVSGVLVVVRIFRRARGPLLSGALCGLVTLAASVGLSLGLAGLLTMLIVAASMTWLVEWMPDQLPSALDGLAGRHRLLTFLYVPLALGAVLTTARVSIFVGDPSRVDQQLLPDIEFLNTHSCLTAYVHAAMLSRKSVGNLYEEKWWSGSHGFPPRPAGVENPYRPFILDHYEYPPPFLFAMAPLAPLEGDFPAQRALWFGLNGLLGMAGLWIVARWIDGPNAHRALVLVPTLFGSLPIVATLQIGNFQLAVVVISVLAMVAFHRKRPALGGALLAFAILSKISPGVLGVVLLVRRRWREAAWTVGFGLLFLALSVLWFGVDPLKYFLTYALPRISSGEAFAFLDDDDVSMLTNMGPFGLPFKLKLLGLEIADPWSVGRQIGHLYTPILLLLAVVAGRRSGDRRTQALIWMSLLVLAALKSPFAPTYTTIGLLWAVTLLTTEVRRPRDAVALVLLWLMVTVVLPPPVWLRAGQSVLQSFVTLGAPMWLIVRGAQQPGARAALLNPPGTI